MEETQKIVEPIVEVVEPKVEQPIVEPTVVKQEVIDPKEARNKILRDMSKEYDVNLFDAQGLKAFKEYQDSQKTELEKQQGKIDAFDEERKQWLTEKIKYESKLLNIDETFLEDALKLADNDISKLAEVVKKYPNFISKDGIKIGITDPKNDKEPTDMSEVEAYMAQDPKYKNYIKK